MGKFWKKVEESPFLNIDFEVFATVKRDQEICQKNEIESHITGHLSYQSSVGGLTDTVLGKMNGFDLQTDKRFIQILHTGEHHWICIANTDNARDSNDRVFIYDSLNSGKVTKSVANCQYVHDKKSTRVEMKKVQQQHNGVDCEPFAIAYATSLAFGNDPEKLEFDQKMLRKHLVDCLKNNHII